MIRKLFLFLSFLTAVIVGCKTERHAITALHEESILDLNKPSTSPNLKDTIIHRLSYLVKSEELKHHFQFTQDSIIFNTNDSTTTTFPLALNHSSESEKLKIIAKQFEATIPKNWLTPHLDIDSTKSLNGVRIALDPGHSAGSFELAKIEGKYVELLKKNTPSLERDIRVMESELNFHTAAILKKRLEDKGATVYMTREAIGESAMGYGFEYWYKKLFHRHLDSLKSEGIIDQEGYNYFKKLKRRNSEYAKKVIFNKLFNSYDFETRAANITAFHPHLTIIIHYNVDVNNDPWETPTHSNASMAFVPGGFMSKELSDSISQFHFFRLLFTDQLDQSIELSNCVLNRIKKEAGIPTATVRDSIPYLDNYSVATSKPGVYARNLALTRTLPGIMCYAEPLYQDNLSESLNLSKKEVQFGQFLVSKRVETIANAYYNGIIDFLTVKSNVKTDGDRE